MCGEDIDVFGERYGDSDGKYGDVKLLFCSRGGGGKKARWYGMEYVCGVEYRTCNTSKKSKKHSICVYVFFTMIEPLSDG